MLQVQCFAEASDPGNALRRDVTKKIKVLGRSKKTKEAIAQLHVLADAKLEPDRQVATALIDACARNGAMTMAQKVFDQLFGRCLRDFVGLNPHLLLVVTSDLDTGIRPDHERTAM